MGKHSSKEAYFKRLQELAEVKKPLLKESTRTIGNLINFKRGADGVAYGIVKENHQYYIKKGGLKENPDASDFTYIGGLGNITVYQYSKLSEADKNRNMILNTINESYDKKISKDGSIGKLNKKTMLTEEVDEDATQDIEQAEEKLDDLDTASQKAAASEPADVPAPEGGEEMPDLGGDVPAPEGGEEMPDLGGDVPAPEGGEEMPDLGADAPAPEGGEEMPDLGADAPAPEGGEEMPDLDSLDLGDEGGDAPAPEGGEEMPDLDGEKDLDMGDEVTPEGGEGLEMEEYEKNVGKLQQSLRELPDISKEKLEDTLKQVLSAYKEKLADNEISIEDRKEIARDYLINIDDAEGAESIPDLGAEEDGTEEKVVQMDVDAGEEEKEEELPMAAEGKDTCNECGSFVQYAESRGYTAESIVEATNEEVANLASGYINAHKDGMNEGDFSSVATHLTNEAFDMLKEEYGFDDDDLTEYQTALNECGDDDRDKKINELWGGLKNVGKEIGKGVAKGAQKAGQTVGQAAGRAWDATKGATQKAGQAVADKTKQAGDWASKTYYKGEVNPHVDKMEKAAKELQQALNSYNSVLQKSGQQPVEINDLLADIFGGMGTPSAPPTKAGKEMTPQQKAAWQRGKGAQPHGVDLSQYRNEGEEVTENLDDSAKIETQPTFAPEGQVLGVGINETEEKIRKYVRNRLQEMMGLKKPRINENAKSPSIKKLDKVIERQFKLYESVVKKKVKLNEASDDEWANYNNDFKELYGILLRLDDAAVFNDPVNTFMNLKKSENVKIIPQMVDFDSRNLEPYSPEKTHLIDYVNLKTGDVFSISVIDGEWFEGFKYIYPRGEYEYKIFEENNLFDSNLQSKIK